MNGLIAAHKVPLRADLVYFGSNLGNVLHTQSQDHRIFDAVYSLTVLSKRQLSFVLQSLQFVIVEYIAPHLAYTVPFG